MIAIVVVRVCWGAWRAIQAATVVSGEISKEEEQEK